MGAARRALRSEAARTELGRTSLTLRAPPRPTDGTLLRFLLPLLPVEEGGAQPVGQTASLSRASAGRPTGAMGAVCAWKLGQGHGWGAWVVQGRAQDVQVGVSVLSSFRPRCCRLAGDRDGARLSEASPLQSRARGAG